MNNWEKILKLTHEEFKEYTEEKRLKTALGIYGYDGLKALIQQGKFEIDVIDYKFTRDNGFWKTLYWLEKDTEGIYSYENMYDDRKYLEALLKVDIKFYKKDILEYCNPINASTETIIDIAKDNIEFGIQDYFIENLVESYTNNKDITQGMELFYSKLDKAIDIAIGGLRSKDQVIPIYTDGSSKCAFECKSIRETEEFIVGEFHMKLTGWDKQVKLGDTTRRKKALEALGILAFVEDDSIELEKCINYFSEVCQGCPHEVYCKYTHETKDIGDEERKILSEIAYIEHDLMYREKPGKYYDEYEGYDEWDYY